MNKSIRTKDGEDEAQKNAGNDGKDFHGTDAEAIRPKFNPENGIPLSNVQQLSRAGSEARAGGCGADLVLLERLIASLHQRSDDDHLSNVQHLSRAELAARKVSDGNRVKISNGTSNCC